MIRCRRSNFWSFGSWQWLICRSLRHFYDVEATWRQCRLIGWNLILSDRHPETSPVTGNEFLAQQLWAVHIVHMHAAYWNIIRFIYRLFILVVHIIPYCLFMHRLLVVGWCCWCTSVSMEFPGRSMANRTWTAGWWSSGASRLLVHLYILQFVVRVSFPEEELLIVEDRCQICGFFQR